MFPPIQRFFPRSGSKVKIEGTSNMHDWQVESSLIGGFLEVGLGFPLEPGQTVQPGPVQARAEAFVYVRSLKSLEKDGSPYGDKMDQIMYESLKSEQYPKIFFRLVEMTLKGSTNYTDAIQYEFESRGELAIAGITNEVTMPVSVVPLGSGKLKISGGIPLKMTSFNIDPSALKIPQGLIKPGDDVNLLFDWFVAAKSAPSMQTQNGGSQ